MRQQHNCDFKTDEVNVFTDLLSGITKPSHEDAFSEEVDLIKESVPVDKSEKFDKIDVVLT